jgi:hypothetical protein
MKFTSIFFTASAVYLTSNYKEAFVKASFNKLYIKQREVCANITMFRQVKIA